jgi:hypothetical protein
MSSKISFSNYEHFFGKRKPQPMSTFVVSEAMALGCNLDDFVVQ